MDHRVTDLSYVYIFSQFVAALAGYIEIVNLSLQYNSLGENGN